jgi:putative methionine-R-sulfoxide reductase with GAF domain
MKFFENKPLKALALYLLTLLLLIFAGECFVMKAKVDALNEAEAKKDYARSLQGDCQQIAYLSQLHISHQSNRKDEIYSRIQDHDHKIKVLGNGGRIDDSDVILKPLSRLPKITFDQLLESWQVYQKNLMAVIVPQAAANTLQPQIQTDTTTTDSVSVTVTMSQNAATMNDGAAALLPGQWLTVSTWYQRLLTDLNEEILNRKSAVWSWILTFILLDLGFLIAFYLGFVRYVIAPIEKLKQNTSTHHQDTGFAKNEIGALATEVNGIMEQLSDATEFVGAIGEGKLDFDYKTLDDDYLSGKNKLADSLISMQSKLKSLNEEEQRRQWANEGLTKFVDILRSSDDNITTLADRIISALVKYTNSNQGGLYVLNDEDEHNKHLELISMFAFDSKKFEKQKVRLGEGILGQTFLEKETTVLTEVPDEYIRITSGLGDANPKALLIVPLKVDKDVYGIVELASFKPYQPHEISFVEKLAETIASTLASVKVGQKNRNLIEQFQQQTEQMRAQEEEMRQNMEELQATQEELSRKEQDYIERIRQLETESQKHTDEELQQVKEDASRKEQEYHNKVRELERKLAERPAQTLDWELAEQVEKDLRAQLEALRITQEELNKKK